MTAILEHAAGVIADRRATYGDPSASMAMVAARWSVTLGEVPELTKRGLPPTGTENYGGPIVTAGGLVFVGATKDERFRAFDKRTGKRLWETALPAGAFSVLPVPSVQRPPSCTPIRRPSTTPWPAPQFQVIEYCQRPRP